MKKDSLVFYKDWWEAIQSLPEGKRLEKAKANGGKKPDMNEYDRMQSNSEEYNNDNVNVNDNDNVNDNVNVNVNVNGNERQSNINITPSQTTDNKNNSAHTGQSAGRSVSQGPDEQIAQCKASQMWKEGIQRKYPLHDTG